jgi:hypothetical protein
MPTSRSSTRSAERFCPGKNRYVIASVAGKVEGMSRNVDELVMRANGASFDD